MSDVNARMLQVADDRARSILKNAQAALLKAAAKIAADCNIPENISGLSPAELLGRMVYAPTMRRDLHRIALADIAIKELKGMMPDAVAGQTGQQAEPDSGLVGVTWAGFSSQLAEIGFAVPTDISKQWDVRTRQTVMEYVQRWRAAPDDNKPPAPSSLLDYRTTPKPVAHITTGKAPFEPESCPVDVGRDMEPLANFKDLDRNTIAVLKKAKIITAADYLGQPAGAKIPGIGPGRIRELAAAMEARGYA